MSSSDPTKKVHRHEEVEKKPSPKPNPENSENDKSTEKGENKGGKLKDQ